MALPLPDPLIVLKGTMAPISSLLIRIHNNLEYLYVGTQIGYIHLWNLETYREVTHFSVGSNPILSILFVNLRFVTQEKEGCIKIWTEISPSSNGSWTCTKTISTNYSGFCKIINKDSLLFCPENKSDIKIFELDSNKEKSISNKDNDTLGIVMCFKYIEENNLLLAGFEIGIIILYDLVNYHTLCRLCFNECPFSIDYCMNYGVVGLADNKIIKFQLKNNNIEQISEKIIDKIIGVSSVSIRSDGKICCIGCWDGKIRYLSMKSLKILAVLDEHSGSVENVIFLNQGMNFCHKEKFLLFAGGKDGKISIWNLYSQK